MARYDQSDPINSTFRVDIAANYPDANLGKLYGVGLDSSGKLIIGAGQDGICGVLVLNQKPGRVGPLREVPRVDVMFSGEITDFGPDCRSSWHRLWRCRHSVLQRCGRQHYFNLGRWLLVRWSYC
jgi:hypothetical protein